jgi:hypothetical protein
MPRSMKSRHPKRGHGGVYQVDAMVYRSEPEPVTYFVRAGSKKAAEQKATKQLRKDGAYAARGEVYKLNKKQAENIEKEYGTF